MLIWWIVVHVIISLGPDDQYIPIAQRTKDVSVQMIGGLNRPVRQGRQ